MTADRDPNRIQDAYVTTVRPDQAEVRAITRVGERLESCVAGGGWTRVDETCRDGERSFFVWRLPGLRAGTEHVVGLRASGETRQVSFSTLPAPQGRLQARIGIVPDLHLSRRPRVDRLPSTPTKRLYSIAETLAARYLPKMQDQVDCIVFPGDTLDPCTDDTVEALKRLLDPLSVPSHLLIGNHELYGPWDEASFQRAFGLPPKGYRGVSLDDVRLLLLHTPDQGSLRPGGHQLRWLERELEAHADTHDVILFAHFSVLLHPCVQGWKNDGMQQLDHFESVLALLARYPRVRAFVGGHKNVPSRLDKDGIIHLLCPQLIQAPCGYSILEVYTDALVYNVYEIEEMDWLQISRVAFGDDYPERFGRPEDRNFTHFYTPGS